MEYQKSMLALLYRIMMARYQWHCRYALSKISVYTDPEAMSQIYSPIAVYIAQYADNGFSGSMEVVRFTDEFKKAFLGYAGVVGGGIAAIKGATKLAVYIAIESEGNVGREGS